MKRYVFDREAARDVLIISGGAVLIITCPLFLFRCPIVGGLSLILFGLAGLVRLCFKKVDVPPPPPPPPPPQLEGIDNE